VASGKDHPPRPYQQYRIHPCAFTYAIVRLLWGRLNLALSPEISAEVILSFAIIAFVIGGVYLLQTYGVTTNNPVFYVPLLYVLNS
jgi:hypothetical protein